MRQVFLSCLMPSKVNQFAYGHIAPELLNLTLTQKRRQDPCVGLLSLAQRSIRPQGNQPHMERAHRESA